MIRPPSNKSSQYPASSFPSPCRTIPGFTGRSIPLVISALRAVCPFIIAWATTPLFITADTAHAVLITVEARASETDFVLIQDWTPGRSRDSNAFMLGRKWDVGFGITPTGPVTFEIDLVLKHGPVHSEDGGVTTNFQFQTPKHSLAPSRDHVGHMDQYTLLVDDTIAPARVKLTGMHIGGAPGDSGGGRGRIDPPLRLPPAAFRFSLDRFEDFVFSKEIKLTDAITVRPQLLDFRGLIEFAPTDDPNIFLARFSQYEFDYMPFDLPGTSLRAISREVLNTSSILNVGFAGALDIAVDEFFLTAETQWLDVSGDLVATSLEFFQVSLTQVSPTVVDMSFESFSTFNVVVPEPSTQPLLIIGFGGLVGVTWGHRRHAGNR